MVAVTGAAGAVGRAVAERLAELVREPAGGPPAGARVRRVIALDDRRGDVPAAVWRVTDVRDPMLTRRLSDVDVVVHLAVRWSPDDDPGRRRAYNVRAAQTVLTAAAAARAAHVIMVTGSMICGPDEAGPPAAEPGDGIAGDLLELEELAVAARAAHPGLTVSVLRPAALVGPGVDTAMSRHFEAPRLLAVRGARSRWQFCHVDDLAAVVESLVLGELPAGRTFAVGAPGGLSSDEVVEISGRKRLELPAAVTFAAAQRLHRLGVTPVPAADLRYVVAPPVLDCAVLRAAGWRPAHDNAAALTVLLEQAAGRHTVAGRRLGGRDAAVAGAAAAGATAAAVGVVVARQVRRRRRS